VLGAEVVELRRGRYAYRFGEQQLNVHGPGSELAQPKAARPVGPGTSDLCFVWPSSLEEALARLEAHGVELELGPLKREGARGTGDSATPVPTERAVRQLALRCLELEQRSVRVGGKCQSVASGLDRSAPE